MTALYMPLIVVEFLTRRGGDALVVAASAGSAGGGWRPIRSSALEGITATEGEPLSRISTRRFGADIVTLLEFGDTMLEIGRAGASLYLKVLPEVFSSAMVRARLQQVIEVVDLDLGDLQIVAIEEDPLSNGRWIHARGVLEMSTVMT